MHICDSGSTFRDPCISNKNKLYWMTTYIHRQGIYMLVCAKFKMKKILKAKLLLLWLLSTYCLALPERHFKIKKTFSTASNVYIKIGWLDFCGLNRILIYYEMRRDPANKIQFRSKFEKCILSRCSYREKKDSSIMYTCSATVAELVISSESIFFVFFKYRWLKKK